MRISVDENDKAYDEKWHFVDVEIRLDGKKIMCVTADTETGYIKGFEEDEDGKWLLDDEGLKIEVEKHGKVEIIGDLT